MTSYLLIGFILVCISPVRKPSRRGHGKARSAEFALGSHNRPCGRQRTTAGWGGERAFADERADGEVAPEADLCIGSYAVALSAPKTASDERPGCLLPLELGASVR